MLAAARTAERQCPRNNLLVQVPGSLQPAGFGWHQDHRVEIAVTDMAYDRCRQARRGDVFLRAEDRRIQQRNGNDGIGRNALVARLQRQARPVRVMPRLPQLAALCRVGGPAKAHAVMVRGDLLSLLRLLGHRSRRAMEFKEKGRLRLQTFKFRICNAGCHLHLVQQFHACDRNTNLHNGDHRFHRAAQRGELTGRGRHSFGDAVQAKLDFGDDAKSALGADEQPRQVVAGR